MELPANVLKAFTEAEYLFSSGDIDAAIKRMDEALPGLKGDILEADALNNKGYYLLHQAKWEEAIACFEQAYLIDVSFVAVLNHLAWAALMIGNRAGAEALMDLFEKQNADYQALHHRNKALVHLLDGELENAKKAIKAGYDDDPYLPYLDLLMGEGNDIIPKREYPDNDLQFVFLKDILKKLG